MTNETALIGKKEYWQKELNLFLSNRNTLPIEWGTNDCCLFTLDAINAMTGEDLGAWGRGKYSNKYQAFKVLQARYGLGFFDTFNRIFTEAGFQETNQIQFGDIAFVEMPNLDEEAKKLSGGVTLTVVWNKDYVIAPGLYGLVFVERFEIVKAWTI